MRPTATADMFAVRSTFLSAISFKPTVKISAISHTWECGVALRAPMHVGFYKWFYSEGPWPEHRHRLMLIVSSVFGVILGLELSENTQVLRMHRNVRKYEKIVT